MEVSIIFSWNAELGIQPATTLLLHPNPSPFVSRLQPPTKAMYHDVVRLLATQG